MQCMIHFRVLRQIFQSLKQIVDVLLLLLFVIAFFSLIGEWVSHEVTEIQTSTVVLYINSKSKPSTEREKTIVFSYMYISGMQSPCYINRTAVFSSCIISVSFQLTIFSPRLIQL